MQSKGTVSKVHKDARQGTEAHRPEKWAWVEACVWTERMLAALENGVKGGKWFSLIDKIYARRTLESAWERVRANRGAAGVDKMSIERFGNKAPQYLKELSEALRKGEYQPQAVRRVHIPKGDGRTRPLGIPVVKDRIVQTAMKMVLEPIFEHEFHPSSYGFRPGRGCKDALREVDRLLQDGYVYVVDADLKSYFDTIPHKALMNRIEEKVSDSRVLRLIAEYLSQDILEGMRSWTPEAGSPQGAVISPLLANVYLHPLDVLMAESGHKMIRYADDFVILCRSREEADTAMGRVRKWIESNGLTLHPDKTHIGDCRVKGQGFEFLGYRFECGERHVRRKSMKAIRNKIREKTCKTCGQSLKMVIESLNPMLRGWFGYFKHAHKWTFRLLDGFVRRRLRSILRKQQKMSNGTGRNLGDHQRWPNAYFAELGLFTLAEAHALACQSR